MSLISLFFVLLRPLVNLSSPHLDACWPLSADTLILDDLQCPQRWWQKPVSYPPDDLTVHHPKVSLNFYFMISIWVRLRIGWLFSIGTKNNAQMSTPHLLNVYCMSSRFILLLSSGSTILFFDAIPPFLFNVFVYIVYYHFPLDVPSPAPDVPAHPALPHHLLWGEDEIASERPSLPPSNSLWASAIHCHQPQGMFVSLCFFLQYQYCPTSPDIDWNVTGLRKLWGTLDIQHYFLDIQHYFLDLGQSTQSSLP